MAHDIFVCHAHADLNTASAACAKLEAAGVRCWIAPRDVDAGPYARQLVHAITSASAVLLIFSDNTNKSEHVLRELEIASKHQKVIIPFRIEDVPPNEDLEYFTLRVHWLDALSPPMETRLAELVAFVKRLLAAKPVLTAPVVPETAVDTDLIDAEKRDAEQREAERLAAEQREAEKRETEQREAEKREAEQRANERLTIAAGFGERTNAPLSKPPSKTRSRAIVGAIAVAVVVGAIALGMTARRAPAPVPSSPSPEVLGFLQYCPMHGATVDADFAHGPQGWTNLPSALIGQGSLSIKGRDTVRFFFHQGRYRDGAICTDVTADHGDSPKPPSNHTAAGLIFWGTNTGNEKTDEFYTFDVNQWDQFFVSHLSHNKWTAVIGLTYTHATGSRSYSGDALAVRLTGNTASLYINGTKVGTLNRRHPELWSAGVFAEIDKEPVDTIWRFDAYGVASSTAK
jgi:hypothetical protein